MAETRFLIVDPSIGRTGALQCARQLAIALHGVAPCQLVLPEGSHPPPTDLACFECIHHLPLRNPRSSIASFFTWIVSVLVSAVRLRWLLHRCRSTHLVLNDWYLLQGVLCRLLGFRGVILTWVRLDPWRFGRWPAAMLFRLIAFTSSHLVVVSRHVQRRLPIGVVSTLLYDSLLQSPLPPLSAPGQRLVYVGNYTPGKGQDLAIEAFAQIAAHYPAASLDFYGGTLNRPGNARWLAALKKRVNALGLSDRLHFHGFVDDPRTVLQGAYASLNLSEAESFSLTVLEASAAGIPVIATNCGGPAEIILHGHTGLLVPVGDIGRAADALHQLLDDPVYAQQMGAAGAKHTKSKFSPDGYRTKLIHMLSLRSM